MTKNLIAIFEILRFAQNDSGERFFTGVRMTQKAVTLSNTKGLIAIFTIKTTFRQSKGTNFLIVPFDCRLSLTGRDRADLD